MGAAAKIVEDHGGIVAGTGSDSLILVDLIHISLYMTLLNNNFPVDFA